MSSAQQGLGFEHVVGGPTSVPSPQHGCGGGPTSVPSPQQGQGFEHGGGPTSVSFAQQVQRNRVSGGRTSARPPHHLHVICNSSNETEVHPTRRYIILKE